MFDWFYGIPWFAWIGFIAGFLFLFGALIAFVYETFMGKTHEYDYVFAMLFMGSLFVIPIICGGQFETCEKTFYPEYHMTSEQQCEVATMVENESDLRTARIFDGRVEFTLRKNDARFLDDYMAQLSFKLYDEGEYRDLLDEKEIEDCIDSGGQWFKKLDKCMECEN